MTTSKRQYKKAMYNLNRIINVLCIIREHWNSDMFDTDIKTYMELKNTIQKWLNDYKNYK